MWHDRLVNVDAEIIRWGRSIASQVAEVMVPRALLGQLLAVIAALNHHRSRRDVERRWLRQLRRPTAAGEPPPDLDRRRLFSAPTATIDRADLVRARSVHLAVAVAVKIGIQ